MSTYLDEEKGASAQIEDRGSERLEKKMTVKEYLASRFPTLKPPMTRPENPFKLLGLLSKKDWLFFSVAMSACTYAPLLNITI